MNDSYLGEIPEGEVVNFENSMIRDGGNVIIGGGIGVGATGPAAAAMSAYATAGAFPPP